VYPKSFDRMSEIGRELVFRGDGAAFDLLRLWMEHSSLPNLAAVARNGASGKFDQRILLTLRLLGPTLSQV
jgi:hypothetical protein